MERRRRLTVTPDEAATARKSALIYLVISFGAALVFLLATLVTGKDYTPVARVGGAAWVFLLTMIITMPLVIPAMKKRERNGRT
ncbi:MAG: hypothetical protein H5U00_09755 [Clostridia bacterium]|nr:hypothetical protein [Clostridia bacterium]